MNTQRRCQSKVPSPKSKAASTGDERNTGDWSLSNSCFVLRYDRGNTLMVTLLLCLILGILMASYLWVIKTQELAVARSQRWNKAMVMAETGVEDALALLNDGMLISAALGPADGARWTATTSTITRKALTSTEKTQFEASWYTVTINKSNPTNPVVTATGFVPVPATTQVVSRAVTVTTKAKPAFPIKAPMIVVNTFDANGFNIRADSFDSTLTNLFPGGVYNTTNAMDHGDIVTLSTNNDAVHVGNAKIKGEVRTPPGGVQGVTATVGSQGSVGDNAWVNGGYTGFESGHFAADVTFTFDPVVLPNLTWYSPTGGNPNGTNYTYVLNSATPNYKITGDLSGGQTIYVQSPNTILYVTGSVTINSDQVVVGPGASLSMYVAGPSGEIKGNGIVNGSGVAKNFIYYGLPTNTAINFSGNANYVGSIYAPNADFHLGGGGSDVYDFSGACITKTATMNGHFNFHYDNALQWLVRPNGFTAITWNEL